MSHDTNLDENIEGYEKFRACNFRISLALEENELDTYISGEVPAPEGDEDKELDKKNLVKAKKIIVDSIKDNLIPQGSSPKTPKDMF